jgi:hypothetical protein
MGYYKIENVTNKLPKRHSHKDRALDIEYVVGFQKKTHKLGVGQEIMLSCRSLPVSIHGYRAKGFVRVVEISENEFLKLQKPSARKRPQKTEVVEKKVVKKASTKKKRTYKKTTTTLPPEEGEDS